MLSISENETVLTGSISSYCFEIRIPSMLSISEMRSFVKEKPTQNDITNPTSKDYVLRNTDYTMYI
jgi:hypothetical protein